MKEVTLNQIVKSGKSYYQLTLLSTFPICPNCAFTEKPECSFFSCVNRIHPAKMAYKLIKKPSLFIRIKMKLIAEIDMIKNN